ncbi:Serine/threonine protein phosphatase PrpC [Streptomyces sp. 2323.1]|uniref:protein phosphatase 2C domain-containing protein n=1 Tax=Streptomyces sp. 2323.1 TaxID=1938841 RepID=UPI000BB87114|nr:protein phosphatase 2C domain-containing protein [Streptomyces sp. 2323.1]SOE10265.1 Serine/threonine protein phosphatase PrpC [Streptomyces sp. 2323.1]
MKQQGTGRGHEDDWWRRLYGDGGGSSGGGGGDDVPESGAVGDTGPSDAPDTLDDRVASALRALAAPGRADRAPQRPPARTAPPPPKPPRRADTVPPQEPRRWADTEPQEPLRWAEPADGDPPGQAEPAAGDPPERPDPAAGEPPGRAASPPPPAPSAPIPLQSTGPGTRPAAAPRRPAPAPRGAPGDTPPAATAGVAGDRPPAYGREPGEREPNGSDPGGREPNGSKPNGSEPNGSEPNGSDPNGPDPNGYEPDPPGSEPNDPEPTDPEPPHYGPNGYAPEPGPLPAADPAALDELVPDTALDGARYGSLTLRAASRRGDLARHRGDVRRDALLTVRFGAGRHALLLVAVATGLPGVEGAPRAARDACAWIGGAVGRSYTRLAEDIRTDQRDALKSGLQRLLDRSYGKLRARAEERGVPPEQYTAALRCLLLPADPECRTRVFFGVGAGGLFRLRDGAWQDLEPAALDHLPRHAPADAGDPPPPAAGRYPAGSPARPEPFLFRTAFARPGDTLLLCSAGFAEPLHQEPAFAARLAAAWSAPEPPGLADFLTAAQLRVEGHPKDRTAVGVWES